MHLALTDEQSFLVDAADDALSRHPTLEGARAALDGAPAPELWPVAVDAGWTGLLVAEDADGAGLSAREAVLVLERCGRRLADARLLGHLAATGVLEAAGAEAELRAALAVGARRAALVDAATADRGRPLALDDDGSRVRVQGTLRGILDAAGADVLVVTGRREDGHPAAVVVAGDADGLAVEARRGYDATRSLADVTFASVPATWLELRGGRVRDGAGLQRLLLAAESVGAADACLAMARDYAVDRVAFGRPIGSYQAIKHKIVEMLRRIEGARSLVAAAGRTWDDDRAGFALLANAARVVAAEALGYAAPENIFVHGGVGATWEHDASLFYRRAELSRRLSAGTDAAADAVAAELLDAETVPREGPAEVAVGSAV